jgi:hypothetical protein
VVKKIIIPIALLAAVFVFRKVDTGLDDPAVMTHPVYAETRVSMQSPQGAIDMLILTKTADQKDCEAQAAQLDAKMKSGSYAACPSCTAPQSKCLSELPARFANLFDNKPGAITYLSLDRGQPEEREHRVIYWGITVEQSDTLCGAVPAFQEGRKGAVTCVRARRG